MSWSSKRQTVVAMSTAESEYIAACHAAKEALWLKRVCAFIGVETGGAVPLAADNQAAIQMAYNNSDKAKTKHIDVAYHFLRQVVTRGYVTMAYTNTDDNPADIYTKALGDIKFKKFRAMIGMG